MSAPFAREVDQYFDGREMGSNDSVNAAAETVDDALVRSAPEQELNVRRVSPLVEQACVDRSTLARPRLSQPTAPIVPAENEPQEHTRRGAPVPFPPTHYPHIEGRGGGRVGNEIGYRSGDGNVNSSTKLDFEA